MLQEKIAKSLIEHEQFLAASFYGKFFARSVNLQLYQRRPGEWKTQQAKSKAQNNQSHPPAQVHSQPPVALPTKAKNSEVKSKSKRARDEKADEIDQVFDEIMGKKRKVAGGQPTLMKDESKKMDLDQNIDKHNLQNIVGAIKKVPKNLSSKHR